METIKHLLKPHVYTIKTFENEQAALVYQMYKVIEEYLEVIMNTKWMSDKS